MAVPRIFPPDESIFPMIYHQYCRVFATSVFLLFSVPLSAADLSIPENVEFTSGIEYSAPGGESLQLNLAKPKDGEGPFPAVMCIHGGGFRAGTRESYDSLCVRLAERGYVAATITYRLAPQHQFPAAIHDCKGALRYLRGNASQYKIDPERIGVTGGSAGGHLAQFMGLTGGFPQFEGGGGHPEQSTRVSCVVNVYGPSDFTQSYGKSVDAHVVLPMWLGGNLQEARKRHVEASPLYWVTPAAAPTLVIHGTHDQYVAYEQGVWMVERLLAAQVEAVLFTIPNAGHGFKGEDQVKSDEAMFGFFEKHLKSLQGK